MRFLDAYAPFNGIFGAFLKEASKKNFFHVLYIRNKITRGKKMTEINKNLSVNGLSFEGLKHGKKAGAKKEEVSGKQTEETNLDKAPGALYGRVGIKSAKDVSGTKECVQRSTDFFNKNADKVMVANWEFENAYDNAIANGASEEEAYEAALLAKTDYLNEVENAE